ncbi:MAG: heme exporter protein CcmB [Proteobacteria bacterium]|nr:heme exporter protein CcmB [Pseudomonadota bacterium]
MAALRWGLARDLAIAFRSRNELVVQLVFFVLVASLFPLTLAPEPGTLAMLGPGVLWVAALLSSLLALPRLFGRDFDDGTLAQVALSPRPLPALVSGKMLAHWLVTGLPVVVLAPVLGAAYRLDAAAGALLAASLALGTPILSLLGGIVGALTLGARGGSGLAALLALPLYVPVLIFGSGAVAAQAAGLSASPHLSLLAAGLLLAGMAAPFAAAAAIRIALD